MVSYAGAFDCSGEQHGEKGRETLEDVQAQDAGVPMLDASLRIDYQVSTSGRGLHQGAGFFCLDNEVCLLQGPSLAAQCCCLVFAIKDLHVESTV